MGCYQEQEDFYNLKAMEKKLERKGFQSSFEMWGQSFWEMMHSVTFSYPESAPTQEQKARVLGFFSILPFLLPCSLCGLHFTETMGKLPLTDKVLESRDSLSRWLVDIHNEVNERIAHKPVPYDTVKTYYLEDHTVPMRKSRRCPPEAKWILPVGIVAIICIVAAVLLGVWKIRK